MYVRTGKNTEQGVHKRRTRYKGNIHENLKKNSKRITAGEISGHDCPCHQIGNTPAGMHISIMVQEILDFLKIQPGEVGFDATLGYADIQRMLKCREGKGPHLRDRCRFGGRICKDKKRLEDRDLGRNF